MAPLHSLARGRAQSGDPTLQSSPKATGKTGVEAEGLISPSPGPLTLCASGAGHYAGWVGLTRGQGLRLQAHKPMETQPVPLAHASLREGTGLMVPALPALFSGAGFLTGKVGAFLSSSRYLNGVGAPSAAVRCYWKSVQLGTQLPGGWAELGSEPQGDAWWSCLGEDRGCGNELELGVWGLPAPLGP